MSYQIFNGGVVREADNASIPNDPKNKDWKEYQNWLSEGNTPGTDLQEQKDTVEEQLDDLRQQASAAKKALKDNLKPVMTVPELSATVNAIAEALGITAE